MVLQKDWDYLQVSDHFYYMCTKFFSDGAVHSYFNPYDTPYDAFINYMNVLSDFKIRLKNSASSFERDKEIEALLRISQGYIKLGQFKLAIFNLEKVKTLPTENLHLQAIVHMLFDFYYM